MTIAIAPHSADKHASPRDRSDPALIDVVSDDAPFLDHTLSWLSTILGIRFARIAAPDGDAPTIEYAASRNLAGALWIPRHDDGSTPPLDPAALIGNRADDLSFDVFRAIRYWLSDAAHADASDEAFDRHGRLTYSNTIFATRDLPAIPIVNQYVNAFRAAVERKFAIQTKPLWPDGRKACVVLTHDVDAPLDPNTPATRRQLERLGGATALTRLRSSLRDTLRFARVPRRASADRHWLFEEIAEEESRRGFRSTFFFASRHFGMPQADRALDVRYDIAARPFRRLFPMLIDRGFEIALHASYNAHEDPAMFGEEIDRLERCSGVCPRGVRHHYWHLGRPVWPTLDAHASAGLHYDASLAFNEAPGFRFGVALPFHPFNPRAGRPVPTLQIPTMLMDGAIFYRPDATAADGVRIAGEWIDRLVDAGGCGAIDWHVRTAFPGNRAFAEWGRAYLAILDALAARSDLFVTSCSDLLDHLNRRHP